METNDIIEIMRLIDEDAKSDPAMLGRLIAMTKMHAPVYHAALVGHDEELRRQQPMTVPSLASITCAQLTLYDNWRATDGRKPSRKRSEAGARQQRFKAQMDIWTTGPETKISTKSAALRLNFVLMDQAERRAKIAEYSNPSKSSSGFVPQNGKRDPEWNDFADMLTGLDDAALCGPGFVKSSAGTNFLLGCVGMIRRDDAHALPDDMQIVVRLGSEDIIFRNFDTAYAGRVPLAGNAVRSSRLALSTHHPAWRTGILYREVSEETATEVVPIITDADVPY
ncbi:hypothetical protein ASG11_17835 [Sphingomonas sp. Leaf357]|uniref:hypothetical protein n=1 Tax=Sphingomonas sp. Leaf357 TaxID=1736350 RepID=UPI0006F5C769|nr:hypothetical protein [Sphingomonas sp. Leaf357]KQS01515.1 hypothetical protein ASG11_17835 [Sphingomonas sp. Leaf357]